MKRESSQVRFRYASGSFPLSGLFQVSVIDGECFINVALEKQGVRKIPLNERNLQRNGAYSFEEGLMRGARRLTIVNCCLQFFNSAACTVQKFTRSLARWREVF
jgi:hypothetical protein